jgi:hypothetical protein
MFSVPHIIIVIYIVMLYCYIKLSLPSGSVYAKKKPMTHPDYVLPEQWESINFLTSWTFLHTGSPQLSLQYKNIPQIHNSFCVQTKHPGQIVKFYFIHDIYFFTSPYQLAIFSPCYFTQI